MARESSQSSWAVAWGMAALRWTSSGSRGWVAPEAGHALSLAPRNQMASAVRPADSAGPAIWMGASRDSGAKRVSSRARARAERNSDQRMRRPSKPSDGAGLDGLQEAVAGLKLGGGEGTRAGPAGGLGVVEGRVRPSREGFAACGLQRRGGFGPGRCGRPRRAGAARRFAGREGVQGPAGALCCRGGGVRAWRIGARWTPAGRRRFGRWRGASRVRARRGVLIGGA